MTIENSSAASQIPLLTFNSLYGILREEKKSRTLQPLPAMFYEGVKTFLENKKNEIKKLKSDGEQEKLSKEMRVYRNSKKILEELVVLRLTKICALGIKESFFGDENTNMKEILQMESDFLEKIVKSTKQIREVLA